MRAKRSKVYWMNARSTSLETSLIAKMLTVFEAAGFDKLIKPKDLVAIKLHCGEWNNTNYLRPVYARALADRVKALGGRPFVCDTTTLPYAVYPGRVTGLDFFTTAERNGYSPAVLGCPFVCADGFMGTDDYRVDLPEGYILKEAYVATAIAAADVLITLTHFKGHMTGVIGGAVKNLGIGAQSKRGKFNVHMGRHPRYGMTGAARAARGNGHRRDGINWQLLEDCCPWGLIHAVHGTIEWDQEKCPGCRSCLVTMTSLGLMELDDSNQEATNAAIADACLATVKAVGKGKVGFINLALDVSPGCDCVSYGDVPMVPHLGVFASHDPVAIDKACVDKATEAMGIAHSMAADKGAAAAGVRKFETCSSRAPGISEEMQLATGEIIGLGSRRYELVEVPAGKPGDFAFDPDPRPVGVRLRSKFAKFPPFPAGGRNGGGYARKDKVDLDRLNPARTARSR
jgi:uncharacterized Fe-S center protein